MRHLWQLISMLVLLLGFIATPARAQEATTDYENIDPSGQSIAFWYQHSGEREEALQAIIQEFNATNPYGITVEGIYQGGYGDIFNKMLSVLNTPNAPSLVVAYQNQAATYQLNNGLVDMRALLESETYGLDEAASEDFFPAFFDADVFSTFEGARLGFPPNRSAEVMYANTDWLNELSAAGAISFEGLPQTPDQFAEAACAATETPYSEAVGEADSVGYELSVDASRFASWTFAFGGNVFDNEANQYTYNSPEAIEAMQFLQGLFERGCAVGVSERLRDETNFGLGTTLFTVGSSSDLPAYISATEAGAGHNWTIGPLPDVMDEPVVNIYGASVSIPKTTPEKELAAWLFLKYYTSPDIQAEWARASNYFPVRASVAAGLDDYFEQNTAYETGFSLLQFGSTEPPVPGYDFVRDLVEVEMAAIMDGAQVVETLDAANAEANDILAEQFVQLPD